MGYTSSAKQEFVDNKQNTERNFRSDNIKFEGSTSTIDPIDRTISQRIFVQAYTQPYSFAGRIKLLLQLSVKSDMLKFTKKR